jgi:hydroxylamine reductase (hybrid-cluster protein)
MMFHSYKLCRVKNRYLHYAVVSIGIIQNFNDRNIVDLNDSVLHIDEYTRSYKDLTEGNQSLCITSNAVIKTLEYFNHYISSTSFFEVKIKQVFKTTTDTHEGDLAAAACAVTWKALGLDISDLQFLFLPDHTIRVFFPKSSERVDLQCSTQDQFIAASEAGVYSNY